MQAVFDINKTDEALHRTDIESLEKRIMELALARTGANHGAIFLYDPDENALAIDFHVVESLIVTLPGALLRRRKDGRPNGIAYWVLDHNAPYVCRDADKDANYAQYFLDVASITAVPIPYQGRCIGVISVSSRRKNAFDDEAVSALEELAASSAKFLRRAQLYRTQRDEGGRPFLIKGLSPEWLEVERRIENVAPTDAPVLVHGESGTGKDLVARATHFNSRRRDMPFVTVNCAAIPEALLESVLFGHVRGAFTGATVDKIGEFQKADGGTLFLDEIGELPMALQAKVLRAVEQGEVLPLGSNELPSHVDVRVICATNRDLSRMVKDRTFRDDLYYRLSVMTMELPPLRSYQSHNLEVLAHIFLDHATRRHQLTKKRFSDAAMARLAAYDFPGNVRELKNCVEHAAIMASDGLIDAADLPKAVTQGAPRPAPPPPASPNVELHLGLKELRERWLEPRERRYLTALLKDCDGNVRNAALRAGINTVTMYRLLKKRGLKLSRQIVVDDE